MLPATLLSSRVSVHEDLHTVRNMLQGLCGVSAAGDLVALRSVQSAYQRLRSGLFSHLQVGGLFDTLGLGGVMWLACGTSVPQHMGGSGGEGDQGPLIAVGVPCCGCGSVFAAGQSLCNGANLACTPPATGWCPPRPAVSSQRVACGALVQIEAPSNC